MISHRRSTEFARLVEARRRWAGRSRILCVAEMSWMFSGAGWFRSCGIACALAVLVVGCASDRASFEAPATFTPQERREAERLFGLALDRWIARSARLQRVSQRLRIAGRELCGRRISPILGMAVQDLSRMPEVLRGVARRRFGTEKGLVVLAVFPDMAAERAGVQPGDRLVGLEGRRIGEIGDLDVEWYAPDAAVEVELEQNGGAHSVRIRPDPGCEFPAELLLSELINAFADYRGAPKIAFTTSLVREVPDDSVLAMIVGHELAHHILKTNRARESRVRGESRADYVGIYLAAMAGFPLSQDAADVYLVLERDLDRFAKRSGTHPMMPARTLAFRKTLEEIEKRKRDGLPLRPDD